LAAAYIPPVAAHGPVTRTTLQKSGHSQRYHRKRVIDVCLHIIVCTSTMPRHLRFSTSTAILVLISLILLFNLLLTYIYSIPQLLRHHGGVLRSA
jgi:hypothetical protein